VKRRSGLLLMVVTFVVTSCSASLPTQPTSDAALQINYGEGFYQWYSVPPGRSSFSFRSFVVDSYGAYRDVSDQTTWTSSNPAVARAPFAVPWMFQVFAPGTVEIQAVYQKFVVSVATVTVTPTSPFEPLIISPNRGPQNVGATVDVRALQQNPNSSSQDVTGLATWTSSNTKVATISIDRSATTIATITALAPGTTDIQATYGGLSYSFRFSVGPL